MVHAYRVSEGAVCVRVYDEEAEPAARKNPASWCEARGQPRVKLLPLKEGEGFATVWGFVLGSDWSPDRWRVVTELIYWQRC